MARARGEAQLKGRVWTLLFEDGSRDRLRVGGYYAGHDSKEDLKQELRRQFWEQEQKEVGENLYDYLFPQTSSASSETTMNVVVKDVKAGRRRKAPCNASRAPMSYLTRSAEKRAKLEAAKKRKTALKKRKLLASQKKRKVANDHELHAAGIRRAVTRSCSKIL
ncbi:unnamed protein product [Calypogeia fissa]